MVYCFLESLLSQDQFCRPAIQSNFPDDLLQDRNIGDIPSISEVCVKYRHVKLIPLARCLSPFPEFLRPSAIVGSRAPTPGKSQLGSDFLQTAHGSREIYSPSFEKLLEAHPLFRCFRMKGKGNPPDPYLVLFF
jgi:hypothetical protein